MQLSKPILAIAALVGPGALACTSSMSGTGGVSDAADAPEGSVEGGIDGSIDVASDVSPSGDAAPAGDQASENAVPTGVDATIAPTGYLRVANWAPDAPAVDFCISLHGANSFTGPVVAAVGASDDAGSGGLTFPLVSAYLPVAPGRYDVRAVVGGADSCAAGVAADVTTLPAVNDGAFMTVALIGEDVPTGGDPGLQFAAFGDDFVPSAGPVLRFINACPKLARADFGTRSTAGKLKALFSSVPFGEASRASEAPQTWGEAGVTVDTNGYATVVLSGVTLSARAPLASADTAVSMGVGGLGFSTPGSLVVTIVLVGGTSAGIGAQLLECGDNAGTVGPLGDCAVLP